MGELYLEDLNEAMVAGCSTPGCTHEDHDTLFLHAMCHPGASVEVSLKRGEGALLVACGDCHKPVIQVAVARRRVH